VSYIPRFNKLDEKIENSVELFVEGIFDKEVLDSLFEGEPVIIKSLGSCNSVRSIAQAFSTQKNVLFLIDRDHYPYDETSSETDKFSELKLENNIIVWSKRELENYFIEPDFLFQLPPNILNDKTKEKLRKTILEICQERLFLDIANYVIASIRGEMRKEWIQLLSDREKEKFSSQEKTLDYLQNLEEWKTIRSRSTDVTSKEGIAKRFDFYYQKMVGDAANDRLQFTNGYWLDMISGKNVLNVLINKPDFFQKVSASHEIAIRLMRETPQEKLPSDFIKLKNIVIQLAKTVINY